MILTITVTTLVVCLGGYFIKDAYFPSKKEERQRLLNRFKKQQELSLMLQDILSDYIAAENAGETIMTDDITYNAYSAKLEKYHENYNSDYAFNKVKYSPGTTYKAKVKRDLILQAKELEFAKKHILKLQNQKSLAY